MGKTRHGFGRDKFVDEVWKWKESKQTSIENDLNKLGTKFDWDKSYFTLDKVL